MLGHFGFICRLLVTYLSRCIIRQRAITSLDNARCALSGFVNAQLQAGERAFTEKPALYIAYRAVSNAKSIRTRRQYTETHDVYVTRV